MRVRVIGGVGDVAREQREVVVRARADMVRVVRSNLRTGNRRAQEFARKRSGTHGRLYPKAFSAEMYGSASAITGGGLIAGEFGPDSAMKQGGMDFERGSRNQPAHHDIADAADITTPQFRHDAAALYERWFA